MSDNAIENIMGNPPSWILRWGITIIALALATCIGVMALIQYPDILSAEGTLMLSNAPVEVTAENSGEVAVMFAGDKSSVNTGDIILILKDAADWRDVLYLDSILHQDNPNFEPNKTLRLGELNEPYRAVCLSLRQKEQTKVNDITEHKVSSILNEIKQITELNASLSKQLGIYEQELENTKRDYQRNQKLLNEGVISVQEFEKNEIQYLQAKRQAETLRANLTNNNIRIEQLKATILDVRKNKLDQTVDTDNSYYKNLQTLITAVELWKRHQILTAQLSGALSFTKPLQTGNYVVQGDMVCKIVPNPNSVQSAIIYAQLPAVGAGKVEIGQEVDFVLDNYPEYEFGVLKSKVTAISPIPNEKKYAVSCEMDAKVWRSTYGKIIPLQQSLLGQIRIHTQEYSILQRVFRWK